MSASDEDILKDAHEAFEEAAEREAENRAAALDDIRFARLEEQWPDHIRAAREKEGRPCLTASRLAPIIRQVVNDSRQNKPAIKVQPQDSQADPETADILSGLIRNIERDSDADTAYDIAVDNAVSGGFGYLRVNLEYCDDASFDQDIKIDAVPNPFSVYGDPYSQRYDSADWNSAFVVDQMPADQFRRRFKGAEEVDWDAAGYIGCADGWFDGEELRVAEWWTREEAVHQIAALTNGEIVGLDVYEANKDLFDHIGAAIIGQPRPVKTHKVTQRLLTGAEVLETVEWAGKFIPIIPVYGDEVNLEGKRHFRSLIRSAKELQQMLNYHHTTMTETLALAPKTPFIGPKGAFKTDAVKWETANQETHAYIEYDGPTPPQRQQFAGAPLGDMQAMLAAADHIKAVTGIYDASLGARSNETSGKAIVARQREGDTSTFHFIDNLTRAIRHTGRVVLDLIPKVYNSERIIRVLGPEGDPKPVPLKQPVPVTDDDGQPQTDERGEAITRVYDLSVGKYDLTVTAGPSYTTRREEAAQQMIQLIQAYPDAAAVLGDLLAKNLDWPGADEIAKRLEAHMGQAGDDPEAHQAMQALQGQIADLAGKLHEAMADRSAEQRKLDIEAYKAETQRAAALIGKDGVGLTADDVQAIVLKTIAQLQTPDDLGVDQNSGLGQPMATEQAGPQGY